MARTSRPSAARGSGVVDRPRVDVPRHHRTARSYAAPTTEEPDSVARFAIPRPVPHQDPDEPHRLGAATISGIARSERMDRLLVRDEQPLRHTPASRLL